MTVGREETGFVETVSNRLADVRARITGAGGDPDRITVVAVAKGLGTDAVRAAAHAGLVDIGENYAQELERKQAQLSADSAGTADPAGTPPTLRWHFLGHVQRNKVRRIAPLVHLWQSLDREEAGAEIARHVPGASVLVQVNISGEAAKNGCRVDEAPALVEALAGLGLDVRGLMAVGPNGPPEDARAGFRQVVALADRLGLPERSIGMTEDLEVAVQEGTTMVRIGRALFGPRPGAADRQR